MSDYQDTILCEMNENFQEMFEELTNVFEKIEYIFEVFVETAKQIIIAGEKIIFEIKKLLFIQKLKRFGFSEKISIWIVTKSPLLLLLFWRKKWVYNRFLGPPG